MDPATVAAASGAMAGGLGQHKASESLINSFRLAAVMHRLAFHVKAGTSGDNKEFLGCCISLAKGIDFAIANNQVPAKAQELPSLIKKVISPLFDWVMLNQAAFDEMQVCQCRSDATTKAAIMVMMISVKSACQLGWFPPKESQELLALADEIGNGFGSLGDVSFSLTSPDGPFLQIMERFYPFLKLGHVLLSIQAKPGYAMLVTDFHVSKKMPHSPNQKIRLFVAQTDNIETSACIMNPPQVSFLLNGKGVEKRVNVLMDSGPQLPTNVTRMLKYGTNLLQAMGHFNGHYIIAVAFTDVIPLRDTSLLKDYVQPAVVESNSDSEIIEGPSRISLNCPISRTRIKLPVKGQLCKHLQCFDFGNYVNINMRRPSWRCPHCNQPVCYTDIRMDQNMVKVLGEVGHSAADVIFSADGSWKVVTETDGNVDPVQEAKRDCEDPTSFLNEGPIVLDLTGDNHEMDTIGKTEVAERKPLPSDLQRQFAATKSTPLYKNVSTAAPNVDFSSEFHFSNGLAPDSTILNDLRQFSTSSNAIHQPAQTSDTAIGQEYANLCQMPITRNPIAIQALPAQFFENPTFTATTFSPSTPTAQSSQVQTPPVTSVGHCLGRTSGLAERLHPYSRASPSPPQGPATTSSQNFPATQSWNHPTRVQTAVQLMSPAQPPPPPSQSSSLPQSQTPAGVTVSQQTSFGNGHTTPQMARQQRVNNHSGSGAVQSVSRAGNLLDLTSDTNWRPQGRMRGSLVPGSYSSALDHLIIRPTQQSHTTRPPASQPVQTPPSQLTQSSAPNLNAQIQAFLANHTHQTTQAGSSPIGVPPSPTIPPQNPRTQQDPTG